MNTVNKIKHGVGLKADQYLSFLEWGYGACNDSKDKVFSDIMDREILRSIYGNSCLCPEDLDFLKSLGKDVDGDWYEDRKGRYFWQYTHPHCQILSHYEKWCKSLTCDLEIGVSTVIKKDCDISMLTFLSRSELDANPVGSVSRIIEAVRGMDVGRVIDDHGCLEGARVFLIQNYISENSLQLDCSRVDEVLSAFSAAHKCTISSDVFMQTTMVFFNC